jgi:hypothetical protein
MKRRTSKQPSLRAIVVVNSDHVPLRTYAVNAQGRLVGPRPRAPRALQIRPSVMPPTPLSIPQVEGIDLSDAAAPVDLEVNDGKTPFTISYQVIYSNISCGPSPFLPLG